MPTTEMMVHVVWSTWRRRRFIRPEFEQRMFACMAVKCRQLRCPAIAIGGTDDHVHLLARLHPTVPVARLAGEAKGSSSHFINHEIRPGQFFRWQEGYFATTVSPDDLALLIRYIENQRRHHQNDTALDHWEQ